MADVKKILILHEMVTGRRKAVILPPCSGAEKLDSRHILSDDRLDCITRNDRATNMVMKSAQSNQKMK